MQYEQFAHSFNTSGISSRWLYQPHLAEIVLMERMTKEMVNLKTKLFPIVIVCLLMTLALSACASPEASKTEGTTDSLNRILKTGKILIAIPQDTPLFGTQAKDGSYEGYDVEVAQMLAKDLKVEVELVPVTSANRIPYLTSGKVDLVISSLGVKPERAEVINFSQPYAPFFWAVYGSKDLKVNSVEDTIPYKVGATLGTLEEIAFTDAAPKETKVERYSDQATTVQAYLSGQVDLIVTGNAIAAEMIRDHPEMGIESKFVIQQSPCHIGVRREDTGLLNWVNAAIYSHKLNGDLEKLSKKWFGEGLPDFPNF